MILFLEWKFEKKNSYLQIKISPIVNKIRYAIFIL